MQDFTLIELEEYINILFNKGLNDYNGSSIKSAARCFYEYEPIINDGLTEELACKLIIGKIMANKGSRISVGQYNAVKETVEKTFIKHTELDLTEEEQKDILKMAEELKEVLPKMDIQHNTNAE